MPLSGSVVLITGATGAVGRPLADALLTANAGVAIGVQGVEDVHPVERALRERGVSAFISPCDVRYEEDVVRLVHRVIRHFGRIDMLINAAMIDGLSERIVDYPVDPWRKVMATNLTGSYLLCREVLPWMIRQRNGCIVMLQRMHSGDGKSRLPAAHVTRQAIDALAQQLLAELKSVDVGVHALQVTPPADGETSRPEWIEAVLKLAHENRSSRTTPLH